MPTLHAGERSTAVRREGGQLMAEGPRDNRNRPNRRKVREGTVSCPLRWTRPAVVTVIERVRHARYSRPCSARRASTSHDDENTAIGRRPRARGRDPGRYRS